MKEQRRRAAIAMTLEERNEFLRTERVCRVATVSSDGFPHVSPLWYVWDDEAMWLFTLTKSQRWANLVRDPRVSVLVDGGADYGTLRGVEILGRVDVVGDVPRSSLPHEELDRVEELLGEKYSNGLFRADGKHAWVRVTPEKFVSWDFRKLPTSP